MAMSVLFAAQALEFLGQGGIGALHRRGEVVVMASVLLLERDREGQDFLFGKVFERSHGTSRSLDPLKRFTTSALDTVYGTVARAVAVHDHAVCGFARCRH